MYPGPKPVPGYQGTTFLRSSERLRALSLARTLVARSPWDGSRECNSDIAEAAYRTCIAQHQDMPPELVARASDK